MKSNKIPNLLQIKHDLEFTNSTLGIIKDNIAAIKKVSKEIYETYSAFHVIEDCTNDATLFSNYIFSDSYSICEFRNSKKSEWWNMYLLHLEELESLQRHFAEHPCAYFHLKIKRVQILLQEFEQHLSKCFDKATKRINCLKKKLLQYKRVSPFGFIRSIIRNHFQSGKSISGSEEDAVLILNSRFNIMYNHLIPQGYENSQKRIHY
jgi:hypothetical protein